MPVQPDIIVVEDGGVEVVRVLEPGSVWLVGEGVPDPEEGKLGDAYLDGLTGDVYGPKTISGWGASTGTLAGPEGPPGPPGADGVTDGDKGDIAVSNTGSTWIINDGVVDLDKLGGDVTSAGKALLDDVDAAAQRATLGLATVASTGDYSDLSGTPTIPPAADEIPQDLGTASVGVSTDYAREDHVHAMPNAVDVGADPSGTATSVVSAHEAAADPHPGYALESSVSDIVTDINDILIRLGKLQHANCIYVALSGNDLTNTGTIDSPLRTIRAAAAAAQPGDVVFIAPGTYVEPILPIRWKYDVTVFGSGLRSTVVQPAAGQEFNDVLKVDSGFWCWGISFAGHQADETRQSWAISFDELADNTARGASTLGAYVLKSPYIQNCTSITAEDDAGVAGSQSTGNTGGGIKVDGEQCALNSPIRSMVVDSYTQVNLGGPGCLVKNDGYAQLVSFFGTFCTYHVRAETGGQVNLSGGGTTDFGVYGLMADGYSKSPLYLGDARVAAYGATRLERSVTIDTATDTFNSVDHTLAENDQLTFSATQGTLPVELVTGTTYYVIASELTADTFKISATLGGSALDVSGTADGTYQFERLGATELDVIGFTANRIGSASRPNPGQLMFPQLVFPRNAATELPEAKTFSYFRISDYELTYAEASAPNGPEHEYVSGGTAVIGGTDYGVANATYDKDTGVVTLTTTSVLPAGNGNVTVNGLAFICSTSAYIVSSSVPIDISGNPVDNDAPTRAGYRVLFYSGLNGGLKDPITAGQKLDFRNRSQVSAPSHTFEFVGSGTNYDALPWNGGVPVPANAIVETNNGRVYSSNTNEKGDFAVGTQFSVDGTTGSVTIATDQFNLSGLNFIGPFSRNGGFSTVGEQLREVSNNTALIASTGAPDGNTTPTQFAVKSFTTNAFLQDVTVTAGLPLTITDTSAQDGQGYWNRSREISLSVNEPGGLARLDGSGLVPSSLLPSYVDDVLEFANLAAFPSQGETGKIYVALDTNKVFRWSGTIYVEVSPPPTSTDTVPEGATNLYFTQSRARESLSVSNSNGLTYDSGTGAFSFTLPDTGVTPASYTFASLTVDAKGRITAASSGTPVTSVGLVAPTGFSVSGSPVTSTGDLTLAFATGYSLPTDASQANWDTAYSERLYWDGGATGLDAATGRSSLGLGNSATLDVGTTAGTVAAGDALGAHEAAADPHPGYALESSLAAVATSGAYADLSGTPTIPAGADALPADLGTAAIGVSSDYAREDHVHAMPSATDVGADPAGTAASAISTHEAAADPHPGYALESSLATVATTGAYSDLTGTPALGGAAALDVGTTAGTVAAGDDSRFTPVARSTSTAGVLPALSFAAITYGAMVDLDMAALDGQYRTISLTGDLTFTSSNRAAGRMVVIRLIADASDRTLTFPADWKFLGTKPASIAASKTGVLSLTFFGTADADCVAAWGVQE